MAEDAGGMWTPLAIDSPGRLWRLRAAALMDGQRKPNDSSGLKLHWAQTQPLPSTTCPVPALLVRHPGQTAGLGSPGQEGTGWSLGWGLGTCPGVLSSCWGPRSPPHLLVDSSSTGRHGAVTHFQEAHPGRACPQVLAPEKKLFLWTQWNVQNLHQWLGMKLRVSFHLSQLFLCLFISISSVLHQHYSFSLIFQYLKLFKSLCYQAVYLLHRVPTIPDFLCTERHSCS